MPKKIYKYHRLNQYLFDIIENHQLYFAKPNELNDPFDGWLRVGNEYLTKKAKESFDKYLSSNADSEDFLKGKSREELFEEFLKLCFERERLGTTLYNANLHPGYRICSFTQNPLNELMWAHYGGQSKGVCLEFDATQPPFPEKLLKVKYTNELLYANGGIEVFDVLTTKRKAWCYEKEYRLLGPDVPLLHFDKAFLLSIIFGYKTAKDDETKIIELAKKTGYPNLKFKKVIMNPNTGAIYLEDHTGV
jgi:hypothetical protein